MTVPVIADNSVQYLEDGVALTFAVPFRFLSSGDLQVSRRAADDDAFVPVTGWIARGANGATGGAVTLLGSVAGATLMILRATTVQQPALFDPLQDFPAESAELALDRVVMAAQDVLFATARLAQQAFRAPFGEAGGALPAAATRTGKLLIGNSDGGFDAAQSFGVVGAVIGNYGAWAPTNPAPSPPAWTPAVLPGRVVLPHAPGDTIAPVALAQSELVIDDTSAKPRVGNGRLIYGLGVELGESLNPEAFMLGSDRGHGIAFARMMDRAHARGVVECRLGPGAYDISDEHLQFPGAMQWMGSGGLECGVYPGQARTGSWGEVQRGTVIKCNCLGRPGITIAGGYTRGASFEDLTFVQDHPLPGPGWAPAPYDYVIDNVNTLGELHLNRVRMNGVNNGIRNLNSGRLEIGKLYGQWFTNALYIDQCYDAPHVDFMRQYCYWSGDLNVQAYQQQNEVFIKLGRCDDFFGGDIFVYACQKAVQFVPSQYGSATKVKFNLLRSDCTTVGLEAIAGNCDAEIFSFQHQAQDVLATTGDLALPNSSGFLADANADGGYFIFGNFRSDRVTNGCINNQSSSTIFLGACKFERFWSGGVHAIVNPNGPPILMPYREITDGNPTAIESQVSRAAYNRDQVYGRFANDAAAAGGGVAVGQLYVRSTDNAVVWRAA